MTETLLYLSRADFRALEISPDAAREAVLSVFRDHAAGLNRALPKNSLDIGPGHGFQSMSAASKADGIATVKWVSMAPIPAGSTARGINGVIIVSDHDTGAPLAFMDGDEITLIRTAAMSAAAASHLAPPAPKTIGMVGCGEQAFAHLDAFRALFPTLEVVIAHSRSRASAERLVAAAETVGMAACVEMQADELVASSDIVISMVPGAPGLKPFLDARLLKKSAFVSAVDIGRSWLPESFPAFDRLATDSLEQSKAPYDVNSKPVTTASFDCDLASLAATGAPQRTPDQRTLFCFRGFGLADMALANLAMKRAKERGIGTVLPR